MALSEGAGTRRSQRADVVFVCDLRAWERGHAHRGEPVHVLGGGPVPVAEVARALDAGAFVKAVTHDGVRIDSVVHYGRHLRAELRSALELGAPPAFGGAECVEEECKRRWGLEWDHVDPLAHGGATSMANLAPRCWDHHRDKTERDRAAGLLGPDPPVPRRRRSIPPQRAPAQPTPTAGAVAVLERAIEAIGGPAVPP